MKIKKIRLIFLILTITTCIMIFMFSNQNGEESGETSRGFANVIIDLFNRAKQLRYNKNVD